LKDIADAKSWSETGCDIVVSTFTDCRHAACGKGIRGIRRISPMSIRLTVGNIVQAGFPLSTGLSLRTGTMRSGAGPKHGLSVIRRERESPVILIRNIPNRLCSTEQANHR
jgi:hypothetical protein